MREVPGSIPGTALAVSQTDVLEHDLLSMSDHSLLRLPAERIMCDPRGQPVAV